MHIRSLIAGALLAMACLAFSPVANAAPLHTIDHDICVLNLAQPVTVDHALTASDQTCHVLAAVDAADTVLPGPGDDDGEPAGPCSIMAHAAFTTIGSRQHFDPGRCSV